MNCNSYLRKTFGDNFKNVGLFKIDWIFKKLTFCQKMLSAMNKTFSQTKKLHKMCVSKTQVLWKSFERIPFYGHFQNNLCLVTK